MYKLVYRSRKTHKRIDEDPYPDLRWETAQEASEAARDADMVPRDVVAIPVRE